METVWNGLTLTTRIVSQTLKGSPRWLKFTWSVLAGLVFSLICRDLECFLDTMVMVTCYTAWMTISLPSLYRKLTFKFMCDAVYVISQVFVADFLVFVVHRTFRRYFNGEDPDYESAYYRGFIFAMNSVRIGVIIYCIGRSVPAFIKYAKNKQKRLKRKRY